MIVFVVTKVVIPNTYYNSSVEVENIAVTPSLELAKAKAKGVIADLDQTNYFLSKDLNEANATIDASNCENETIQLVDSNEHTYIIKIEEVNRVINSGGGYIVGRD